MRRPLLVKQEAVRVVATAKPCSQGEGRQFCVETGLVEERMVFRGINRPRGDKQAQRRDSSLNHTGVWGGTKIIGLFCKRTGRESLVTETLSGRSSFFR